MNMRQRFSGPQARANRRLPQAPSVALLIASIAVLVCLMLVSCSSGTTADPQAAQQAHARASLTAGAKATQAAGVEASRTAAAIPLIPLPYMAAAPGPGCDSAGATWTAQTASGVSCLTNPSRVRLTALSDATGNCCQNEADWTFGQSGKLPTTYRVSVQLSSLLDQSSAGQVSASLYVNLHAPSGNDTNFFISFFVTPGTGANYNLYLDGPESGFVSVDLTDLAKPITVAIQVDASGASCTINGITKFHRGVTVPYIVTSIALKMSGPSGDHVDFANLSVEQA